jgi:carbonic anhydrase/acetyltransferase-like protein (isoleucine patch superfamily)
VPQFRLGERAPILPPDGGYWIAPTAVLIGDVRLEAGASVWFGAVLRGDNEQIVIGEDSNVQDGCVLHTDPGQPLILGRGVTVGHGVVLHGCKVGDGSLIGMGSTLLNGVTVGRNCLIGAGALITERKDIPDNSVVFGSPAKVVGSVTVEQHASLILSAQLYRDKWRWYAAELAEAPARARGAPG